ncbi:hypothetical protein [Nocardia asiatica]|uniref:hypothetical protein n=1 Tax=Nocardia asiatica TaxID=209252 RepID=UPI003EE22BEB
MTSEVSGRSGTVLGEVRLSPAEAENVARLVDELAAAFGRVDDPRLLRLVTGWGHRLPAALHEQLLSMRYEESVAGFVVRGALPGVDPGPTPAHWGAGLNTLRHDLWLLLVAAQLGDPVAWSVWQGGELVNDVLPMAGEATAQTGLGSEAELDLHVEEALYDDRCDGLALGCLRNPDRVPTIVAAADAVDWSSLDVDVLFEPRYLIGDEESGRVRPALFGAADSPYLRVDMPYMRARRGDARAAAAFSGLCAHLRAGAIMWSWTRETCWCWTITERCTDGGLSSRSSTAPIAGCAAAPLPVTCVPLVHSEAGSRAASSLLIYRKRRADAASADRCIRHPGL